MPVGQALAAAAPTASRGRLIRLIDATTVPEAGTLAKKKDRLWRIHSACDLPRERFGFFELTDQQGWRDAGSHPGRQGRDPHRRPRPSAARSHGHSA